MSPKESIELQEFQSLLQDEAYEELINKKTYEAIKYRSNDGILPIIITLFIFSFVISRMIIFFISLFNKNTYCELPAVADAIINSIALVCIIVILYFSSRKLNVEIRRGEVEDYRANLERNQR
ncbi:Schizosaccharomyces specific protein [Schizosaccharomyces pombe]|uniref:Putative uncharacterized membrane protein C622.06c n=1 Tax=Schizosaccharomyces pombe (strain 972 / ATCC 24843) TaxID=284812 RepID=YC86_SCHPO|nr:uncharacterized protein SPCC622.06c [Schizosaccharomyces pombe]O94596.1 RecName: Full=Putative uncharacterized membrane protein C622.06c [Schizosaccharomyces pombe 972h-]CAA21862.1 hypothetical protein SPCC622.06c [Schizosaccharomyces pombe]|eukprot:NP_588178.1 uncharacterized protein [Schizosaccharomyces pombe]